MRRESGKRNNVRMLAVLIGLGIIAVPLRSQDEVYSSSPGISEKEFTPIRSGEDTNYSDDKDYYSPKYTKKEYQHHYHYYYDDYDFYYTARIRRFYHPIIGASYWCGYYVDYYYYVYDPFLAGISIYISFPFFRVWLWPFYFWWDWVWIDYYYDPFWWTCSYYRYPWWGYYHHGYWAGYWNGYWDGYWHGYWDGRWDRNTSCYAYNRYQNTVSYHYQAPRGSEYMAGSSVWRTSGTKPIVHQMEGVPQMHINTPLSDMGIKVRGEIAPEVKPSKETLPSRSTQTIEPSISSPSAIHGSAPSRPSQHYGGLQQEGGNLPPKHTTTPTPPVSQYQHEGLPAYKGEDRPRHHIETPQGLHMPGRPSQEPPKIEPSVRPYLQEGGPHYKEELHPRQKFQPPQNFNTPQPNEHSAPKRQSFMEKFEDKFKRLQEKKAFRTFENIIKSLPQQEGGRWSQSNPEPSRPHREWSSPSGPSYNEPRQFETPSRSITPPSSPRTEPRQFQAPSRESSPFPRRR